MRIVYVDVETTGLDPDMDQVLEIGAVVDDLTRPEVPIIDLPTFRVLVAHARVEGNAVAIHMNAAIIAAIIANKDSVARSPHDAVSDFEKFLDGIYSPASNFDTIYVNLGGKNVAGFDLPFLCGLPRITRRGLGVYKFRHRVVDPGTLYLCPGDDVVPDTNECLRRAGIDKQTDHTAVGDCRIVAELIRHRLCSAGAAIP